MARQKHQNIFLLTGWRVFGLGGICCGRYPNNKESITTHLIQAVVIHFSVGNHVTKPGLTPGNRFNYPSVC
ncbi:Uncharacterised protein [Chlamydia abortus]|nr:Uncharacterised protein [Chlamydia abortus]